MLRAGALPSPLRVEIMLVLKSFWGTGSTVPPALGATITRQQDWGDSNGDYHIWQEEAGSPNSKGKGGPWLVSRTGDEGSWGLMASTYEVFIRSVW